MKFLKAVRTVLTNDGVQALLSIISTLIFTYIAFVYIPAMVDTIEAQQIIIECYENVGEACG